MASRANRFAAGVERKVRGKPSVDRRGDQRPSYCYIADQGDQTMLRTIFRGMALLLIAATAWHNGSILCNEAQAGEGWEGQRRVSYQHQKDLFYNYYQGPYGCNAAAQMYVAPQPVPANVGHTYVTYQPLMPHEFLYQHKRGYYTYNPAGGWTRTNVRYRSKWNFLQAFSSKLHYPQQSLHVEALNDFTFADRLGR